MAKDFTNPWGQGGRHWPPKWMEDEELSSIDNDSFTQQSQSGIYIKAKTILGPQFNEKGKFAWGIKWETNAKNGWIIQKIQNIFNITDCAGNNLAIYNDPILKTYWEAWQVKNGTVLDGDIPGTDLWGQGEIGQEVLDKQINSGYKGKWTIKGTVYFEQLIDTKTVWKRNPDLGNLYFTSKDPNIKSAAKLTREASGSVYVCGNSSGWYHKKITIK